MPTNHTIEQGETTIGLSEEFGLFAETIWNDPANTSLKQQRKDMNVLLPGDVLVIPDLRLKEVSKPDAKKHRFKRKGIPAKFRMQVFDGEKPRAKQNYTLDLDGKVVKGTTDGQGVFEQFVPASVQSGCLIIGQDRYTIEIDFGHLDPLNDLSGVQQRLNNLGYQCGEASGEMNPETKAALVAFQHRFKLKETGEADDPTLRQLAQTHDQRSKFPDQPPAT